MTDPAFPRNPVPESSLNDPDPPPPSQGAPSTARPPRFPATASPSPRHASPDAGGVELAVHYHGPDTRPPSDGWLHEGLAQAIALAGVTAGRLEVSVIDDAEMQRLHAEHCDDPDTTDVLTFDLRDHAGDPGAGNAEIPDQPVTTIDGDIMICRDEAERQAAIRGHDARTELLLYAVHGLLHLLGEDDHDEAAYQRMHEREDALLSQMGLGPVFARQGGAASDAATADGGQSR